MSIATSASNAIDYSDKDDKDSSDYKMSDVSIAASSDDSNDGFDGDLDDDDDDGDTEEALFLHNARDIQNRTSRSVGTAAMEDRRFCGLFGVRIKIIEQAKASALDALFFEGLSKGGTRLLRCWRVEGCHHPKDSADGCGSSLSASPSWRTKW